MPRRASTQIVSPNSATGDENINPHSLPHISEDSIQSIRDPAVKDLVRTVQLDNDAQRRKVEQLTQTLEEIQASQPRKRQRRARVVGTDGKSLDDECRKNGKTFLMMCRPWVPNEDVLRRPFPSEDGSFSDDDSDGCPFDGIEDLGAPVGATGGDDDEEYERTQERIKNFEHYEHWEIPQEYQLCLTKDLHDRHDDDQVIDVFTNSMDSLRSSLVHRICKEVPTLVLHDYGITDIVHVGIFGTADAAHNPRLQSLLGYNEASHTYNILAPYLYANEDATNPEALFRVKPLMLALRACLFGNESIRGNPNVAKKSMGYMWGIKEITPGAIAFASILVLYTLSADSEFVERGSKTGINYLLAFRELKAVAQRFSSTEFGKETLRTWQRSVFDGQPITEVEAGQASLAGLDDLWKYIEEREGAEGGHQEEGEEPRSPLAPLQNSSN